jgi:hypothetical protein
LPEEYKDFNFGRAKDILARRRPEQWAASYTHRAAAKMKQKHVKRRVADEVKLSGNQYDSKVVSDYLENMEKVRGAKH